MTKFDVKDATGVFVSFHDRLSGLYSPPMVFPTVAVFERQLRLALQRPADPHCDPLWHQFPQDHDVYAVALFHENTGAVLCPDHYPLFVGHVSDYLSLESKEESSHE